MFPMKPDLQELMITLGEIKHITGEDYKLLTKFIPRKSTKFWLFPTTYNSDDEDRIVGFAWIVSILVGILVSILGFIRILNLVDSLSDLNGDLTVPDMLIKLTLGLLSVLVLPVLTYTVICIVHKLFYILGKLYTRRKHSNLLELFKEVDKHNDIVDKLYVLDQLKQAGNPVQINDRESVIEALKITKHGLVRALATERILRENPTFNPQHFNLDLTSLQAEKTMVKAIEYAELLDNAVQVGVSVQKEMRKLQKRG